MHTVFCRLSNSQGNLLDDTQLIDVLAVTKQTAQDVSDKLANASETNNKINEACEEYRPVAHRATLIYFLIAEFSVVNCMYQTSLAQFNELYEKSIDASEKASMPSKRIANIIEHMTYDIYLYMQVRTQGLVLLFCYVLKALYVDGSAACRSHCTANSITASISQPCCQYAATSSSLTICFALHAMQRGLFERHKLLFALMLTNKILVSSGKVKACDVDVLLKGGGALDIASVSIWALHRSPSCTDPLMRTACYHPVTPVHICNHSVLPPGACKVVIQTVCGA